MRKATFRDVIQRFRAEYPFVRLVLHEMATQQQVEALADGRLQVGFLRTSGARPFSADALALKDFGHEELVLVLRRDHGLAQSRPDDRIAPACLAGEALVVFPREIGGSTYDQIVTVCRAAGFEPKIAQEAREVVTLIGLVSAGLGLALMATTFASILPDGLTTRRLKAPAPTAATWLVPFRS